MNKNDSKRNFAVPFADNYLVYMTAIPSFKFPLGVSLGKLGGAEAAANTATAFEAGELSVLGPVVAALGVGLFAANRYPAYEKSIAVPNLLASSAFQWITELAGNTELTTKLRNDLAPKMARCCDGFEITDFDVIDAEAAVVDRLAPHFPMGIDTEGRLMDDVMRLFLEGGELARRLVFLQLRLAYLKKLGDTMAPQARQLEEAINSQFSSSLSAIPANLQANVSHESCIEFMQRTEDVDPADLPRIGRDYNMRVATLVGQATNVSAAQRLFHKHLIPIAVDESFWQTCNTWFFKKWLPLKEKLTEFANRPAQIQNIDDLISTLEQISKLLNSVRLFLVGPAGTPISNYAANFLRSAYAIIFENTAILSEYLDSLVQLKLSGGILSPQDMFHLNHIWTALENLDKTEMTKHASQISKWKEQISFLKDRGILVIQPGNTTDPEKTFYDLARNLNINHDKAKTIWNSLTPAKKISLLQICAELAPTDNKSKRYLISYLDPTTIYVGQRQSREQAQFLLDRWAQARSVFVNPQKFLEYYLTHVNRQSHTGRAGAVEYNGFYAELWAVIALQSQDTRFKKIVAGDIVDGKEIDIQITTNDDQKWWIEVKYNDDAFEIGRTKNQYVKQELLARQHGAHYGVALFDKKEGDPLPELAIDGKSIPVWSVRDLFSKP